MAKRHPLDLKVSGVGDASGNCVLEIGPFDSGGLLCVQRVAVRSLDRDEIYAYVSLDRAGLRLYLGSITTGREGQPEALAGATYAPSGYGVTVEVSDLAAGGRVEAYVFGYWTEVPE